MKKHILSLLLFCTVGIAFAQTSVSGVVRDSNGDVVPGANIVEKVQPTELFQISTGRTLWMLTMEQY